jgi:DNA-binding GntR family transcriptional regulator
MGKIKFLTKKEIVYAELKKNIINGKYKPNQRIKIASISRDFGISEIPVREAFQLLISEGFLRDIPHVGSVVTGLDMEEMEEIYVVRNALECLATRLSAEKITKQELKLLEANNRKMEKAVAKRDHETIIALNREFHKIIYFASRNRYLYKHIFELWDLSFRIPGVFAVIPGLVTLSLAEHKEILNALKKGDGNQAEELIGKHKKNLLRELRIYFKDNQKQTESTDPPC